MALQKTNWIEGNVTPVAADNIDAKAFAVEVRSDSGRYFSPGGRFVFTRWDLLLAAKVGESFQACAERLATESLTRHHGGTVRVIATTAIRGMGRYGNDCFDIPGITREPATGLPMPAAPTLF